MMPGFLSTMKLSKSMLLLILKAVNFHWAKEKDTVTNGIGRIGEGMKLVQSLYVKYILPTLLY